VSADRGRAPALGAQIDDYIAFKHACGKAFTGGEHYLRRFAAHCEREGFESLTRRSAEAFVEHVGAGKERPGLGWVSYLRGLGRWARANGDPEAWVAPARFAPAGPRPEVYLLAGTEVAAFFGAAAAFDAPDPWRWQAKAFFALMASCGLRTGEARGLRRSDVDPAARTVLVRDSKGPRGRLLPVTGEVAAVLAACDEANERFRPGREAFFTGVKAARVSATVAAQMFRRVWGQAGLPWPDRPPFPRPYALRHRFACANVERWAAGGADPEAALPYLARYMGHASPASTLYYLHVTPDFLRARAEAAGASKAAALLPGVGFDG
jgi:integrase